jgi:hypothetical protein
VDIAVTLTGPPRSLAPRVWRVLAGALGAVCAVAGWIATVSGFIVLLVLVLVWGFAMSSEATPEDMKGISDLWSSYGHPALWAVGIGIAVLQSGVLLVRGRRRLVLFLRRFGDSEATHAATVATRRVGRSWRLITLDDARIAPVGVGVASRTFMGAAKAIESTRAPGMAVGRLLGKIFKFVMIAAAWGAGGAAVLTVVATEGDPDQRVAALLSLFDLMHPASGALGELFWICAWVVIGCGVLFLVLSALSLAFALVVAPYLSFLGVLLGAIGAAEATKNMVIADIAGIVHGRAMARRISRRVVSPRLTVLTVDSGVWQLAVGGMAAVSAIPLIDVSEPSENVRWEIEQMTRRFGPRCVFVGEYDRVIELTRPATTGSPLARQQELLQGHRVLAYTNDEQGVARFARALRATFELAVRQPTPVPRPPDPITKQMTSHAMRQVRQAARAGRRS